MKITRELKLPQAFHEDGEFKVLQWCDGTDHESYPSKLDLRGADQVMKQDEGCRSNLQGGLKEEQSSSNPNHEALSIQICFSMKRKAEAGVCSWFLYLLIPVLMENLTGNKGGWRGVMNLKPKLLVHENLSLVLKEYCVVIEMSYAWTLKFKTLVFKPDDASRGVLSSPSIRVEEVEECAIVSTMGVTEGPMQADHVGEEPLVCEDSLKLTCKLGPLYNPSLRRGVKQESVQSTLGCEKMKTTRELKLPQAFHKYGEFKVLQWCDGTNHESYPSKIDLFHMVKLEGEC
ncbi:hypothetical protein Bca101_059353 [Brassica carinata]